jgi:glycoprotein endo-alpha-1,2-mannosidase
MAEKLKNLPPNPKVHIFYYPWYGTPEHDGKFYHWAHQVLDDSGKRYEPPDEIGADFYPQLGPYSSLDDKVISQHLNWIAQAGIGTVAVSWYRNDRSDDQLKDLPGYSDRVFAKLLDHASLYKLKLCIHLEPYKGMNAATVREDVEYVFRQYGEHPALYRDGSGRPLFYLYDSYQVTPGEWARLLQPSGDISIRGTSIDATMIGLVVDPRHVDDIKAGGFDGFYTYFATDGFTYGSTWANFPAISERAAALSLRYIPSIGPGYADLRIRPWNPRNQRPREKGQYYEKAIKAVLSLKSDMLSITSFNEWHEGTQIDPAVPRETASGYHYIDYEGLSPNAYLEQTAALVQAFSSK